MKVKRLKCKVNTKRLLKRLPYQYIEYPEAYDISITFADVSMKAKLWKKYHGFELTGALRGFCQSCRNKADVQSEIVIFVEPFYNEDALLWILIHELTHYELKRCPCLFAYYDKLFKDYIQKVQKERNTQWTLKLNLEDEVHDNDPEEMLCDAVATNYVGFYYGRKWWRQQLKKHKK